MYVVCYDEYDPYTEEERCRHIPCQTKEEAEIIAKNLSDRGYCHYTKKVDE